jgi:outer membrane lipoprotein carrier protein
VTGLAALVPLWWVLTAQAAFAAGGDIPALLHRIENHYNEAQSLKLSFSESYSSSRRPPQTESGTLYLRKPGRMRWEYEKPAGKLFISDGKEVYLYTPEDRRVEKGKLKESEDMRAPLAFLLGKLDFTRDFRSFESRAEGDGIWIVANPKSQNLAYTKVEFLATPEGVMRRVRVTGQDQSKLDFTFSGEQVNAPVPPAMFVFHAPAGAEVVEAEP